MFALPARNNKTAARLLAALLMLALPPAAMPAKPPELTGPITVTADEVDWNNNQQMEYRGNVRLSADGFTMVGELLKLEQRAGGVWMELTGSPAELEQVDARIEGTVRASADRLTYDAESQWIDLNGNARLNRGNDRVEGRNIRYNVTERRIQAKREARGEQVRIILDNKTLTRPSGTPAPATTP